MTLIEAQASKLKTILETIDFRGDNLSVEEFFTQNTDHFPYIFITYKNMESRTRENISKERSYSFDIVMVCQLENDYGATAEGIFRELESLIVDAIDTASVGNNQEWLDLEVLGSTEPIAIQDTILLKSVKVQTQNIKYV